MIAQLQLNKLLWLLIALTSLFASSIGVAHQSLYRSLTPADNLPAILSQDLITILASVAMLFLVVQIHEHDAVKQLTQLGIVGYLFYVYGIYVLGKLYNAFYILYMAIFSLSFFSLVYGIANVRSTAYEHIALPAGLRRASAAFLFLIPAIFYPMWIVSMWPFMQQMRVPASGSNVYILDMCFVLPAFTVMAVMLSKNNKFAVLLTPVLLIKGITLSASVALTELLRPFYHQAWITQNVVLFGLLTLAALLLAILYFRRMTYASDEPSAVP